MYHLHLPPALPLAELEDNSTYDEDGGVGSCSEVDEAEEVDESDGIERYNDGTVMDPLGAGVVVLEGKVTRQSSRDSERLSWDLQNNPPNTGGNSLDMVTKPSEDFRSSAKSDTGVSDVRTNASGLEENFSGALTNISGDRGTAVSKDLSKVSEFLTNRFEGSAPSSEGSSEIWDGCSIESDNMGFDFIAEHELAGGADNEVDKSDTRGTYHLAEASDVTDGVKRNDVGQQSGKDANGKMNQVSLMNDWTFL